MMIRLRATITLEATASDFADAAVHQRTLNEILSEIEQSFPQAKMEIRQVKSTRKSADMLISPLMSASRLGGPLQYEEYDS